MMTLSRTQNHYTEDQYNKVDALVTAHNSTRMSKWVDHYLIIDLSGDKRVYFTLYSYRRPITAYKNPFTYIKNLSINLEDAVNQVLEFATKRDVPVLLCANDNNNPLVTNFKKRTKEGVPTIPFGKHRGKTIAEIWDIEPNYVMWFLKEYKTKEFNGKMPVLTQEDEIMRENAKEIVSLYFNEIAEKNRETSTSVWVGELKEKLEVELTITRINEYEDYTINYGLDNNGNQFCFYGKFDELVKNEKATVKGTIADHSEKMGIKTTRLNRVKVVKK